MDFQDYKNLLASYYDVKGFEENNLVLLVPIIIVSISSSESLFLMMHISNFSAKIVFLLSFELSCFFSRHNCMVRTSMGAREENDFS